MTQINYTKKYTLSNLENHMHDSLRSLYTFKINWIIKMHPSFIPSLPGDVTHHKTTFLFQYDLGVR